MDGTVSRRIFYRILFDCFDIEIYGKVPSVIEKMFAKKKEEDKNHFNI